MTESTATIDYRRGAGLRVSYDGTVLVLRNEIDKRSPWTVIHLNGITMEYKIGQTLTDKHVEQWWKLTYLQS